jgi:lysophospholipase L1-like esterase
MCIGAQILCIGDSWSYYGCPVLTNVTKTHHPETQVLDYSKSGSKTTDWISTGQYYSYFLNALSTANNDTETHIWFTIGGNDFLQSNNPSAAFQAISGNLVEIFSLIKNQRPKATVVHFGYDFPNISQNFLTALNLTVSQVNEACIAFNTVLNTLKINQTNLQTVDIIGTLQEAGNVTNAPNTNLPSPAQYMRDDIHPNTLGFTVIMNEFYDKYWKSILDESVAASPSVSQSTTTSEEVSSAMKINNSVFIAVVLVILSLFY